MKPRESVANGTPLMPGRPISSIAEVVATNMDSTRKPTRLLQVFSTVAENFRRDGTIRGKIQAVKRSSETQVTAGYHMNIVGFGWTNGGS